MVNLLDLSPRFIGERVVAAREALKMRQGTLAEKAGIHPNTLGKIEQGKSRPTEGTIAKIVRGLGTSVHELFGMAPAPEPAPEAVVAFLEHHRTRHPEIFEGWSAAKWEDYVALGARMGIAKDDAALYFAQVIVQRHQYISMLMDLFDANKADEVMATIKEHHARLTGSRTQVEPPVR